MTNSYTYAVPPFFAKMGIIFQHFPWKRGFTILLQTEVILLFFKILTVYWIKYLSTHGETTIFHGLDITTFVVCYNTSVPNNVVVNTDLANRVHHELYLSHIRVNRMSSMNLIVPLMFLWLFFRADGRDLKNNYNEYFFGFLSSSFLVCESVP